MTTFATLRSNVATYINRTDQNTNINLAINRAISYYARKNGFWFNETTGTFVTVASQASYGTGDGVPSLIEKILDATITVTANTVEVLTKRTLDYILSHNIGQVTGTSTDYTYFQNKIYLSLIPDAVYTITLYYRKGYADLSADADTNDFTNNAEDLIESRAAWFIYSNILYNEQRASAMKEKELDALSALLKNTHNLTGSGKVVPTEY